MVLSDVVIGGLTTAMSELTKSLKDALSFADTAQKTSLALGRTYAQTRDTLGPSINNLRGSIEERFAAGIAAMEAGLQGNTAGISGLINQQRLTGTQNANTAKVMADLEASLGLSRDQTNNLSDNILESGAMYGVSTDKLVDAVEALAATFPAQKLAGMGDKVTAAMATLQSELGPQLAGPLQSVMKLVMDTSIKGYERLTMLGIGDVRERLSAAKDSAEAQKILKDAFVKASETFKGVAGDASQGFYKIGIASEIFGNEAIKFTTIAENLGARDELAKEQTADFGNILSIVKDEALLPLTESFSFLYNIILPLAQGIGGFVSDQLKNLIDKAIIFYLSLGGLQGIVLKVKQKFEESRVGLDNLKNKIKDFGLSISDKFKNIFSDIKMATSIFVGAVVGLATLTLIPIGVVLAALFSPVYLAVGALIALVAAIASAKAWFSWFSDKEEEDIKIPKPTEEKNDQVAAAAAAKRELELQKLNHDQLMAELNRQTEQDGKFLGGLVQSSESTKENTAEINRKTQEPEDTGPRFLNETVSVLGSSIERILGISGPEDNTLSLLEELQQSNMLTQQLIETTESSKRLIQGNM